MAANKPTDPTTVTKNQPEQPKQQSQTDQVQPLQEPKTQTQAEQQPKPQEEMTPLAAFKEMWSVIGARHKGKLVDHYLLIYTTLHGVQK